METVTVPVSKRLLVGPDDIIGKLEVGEVIAGQIAALLAAGAGIQLEAIVGEKNGKHVLLAVSFNGIPVQSSLAPSMSSHSGDCTIYASMNNGAPTDGICTCGYGHQMTRLCDYSHSFSKSHPNYCPPEQ